MSSGLSEKWRCSYCRNMDKLQTGVECSRLATYIKLGRESFVDLGLALPPFGGDVVPAYSDTPSHRRQDKRRIVPQRSCRISQEPRKVRQTAGIRLGDKEGDYKAGGREDEGAEGAEALTRDAAGLLAALVASLHGDEHGAACGGEEGSEEGGAALGDGLVGDEPVDRRKKVSVFCAVQERAMGDVAQKLKHAHESSICGSSNFLSLRCHLAS